MEAHTLKSILINSIKPLTKNSTLGDALTCMHDNEISSVTVVDEDSYEPIGIFTEYDSLQIISSDISKDTPLENVMTKDVLYVKDSMQIHDAYLVMEQNNFRHLIVVDEEKQYLGIVTEGDFLRQLGFERLSLQNKVSDAMNDIILTVTTDMNIHDVAALMTTRKCSYAIVLEDNKPICIINERTLVRESMENPDYKTICVDNIEKKQIHKIQKSAPIQDAIKLMEQHDVHQVVVTSDSDEIIGIINRHDILKQIYNSYFEFLVRTLENKNKNEQELLVKKRELEDKNLFLDTVINTIPDLIWLKDLEGKYLGCNQMFSRFFNHPEKDIIGKTDYSFIDKKLADFFRENDEQALRAKKPRTNEEYLVFGDGSYEGMFDTIKTPMKDSSGEFIGVLGIARDISDRKEKEKELERLANYDQLTNLPNRSFLNAYLIKSLAKAKREKASIALILLDLDRFKDINDSYGHTVGDELLQIVATRLSSRMREGDVVARLGGDEFAVVIENLHSNDDVAKITESLFSTLSSICELKNKLELHIEASAGIAIAPKDGETPEELLQHADTALYQAKSDGRAIYRYYTEEMTQNAQKIIRYENMLRNALTNNELELYYQPQVHMQTGKIVGAEALIRWNNPKDGLVTPNLFIPIAEESGIINSLGEWVINEACRQGKEWQDKGYRLSISVNVSANQFKYQDIPKLITDALHTSGYNPDRLEVELTESAIMQREDEAAAVLHNLRAKGIRIAIDDFGTGYSSLSYLKLFPINVLKIDKSFVDDLPYHKDDMAIVIAIIEMAKALGYEVIAEGTETIEQIEFLKEKGCTLYQGYFKSKPLKAKDFEKLLLEQEH